MSEISHVWLDVLQIIIPALLIVGGGAIAYWKFLREQDNKYQDRVEKRKHDAYAREQILLDTRLKTDEAIWVRMQGIIEKQSSRIDHLEEEVNKLREENNLLRSMLEEI